MKKRIMTVLVPIVLIFLVIAAALASQLFERFSYSKNQADLTEYFHLAQPDEVAMVVQDTLAEEKALLRDGVVYFALSTVEKYFTDRFYVNTIEQVLLFTTDTDVIQIHIGEDSNVMYVSGAGQALDYQAAFYEGDTLYIAADYVKKYANFDYLVYDEPLHMQVYTEWGAYTEAAVSKKTALRYQGGIKSDILVHLAAGDLVTVLEKMENWSKVKTADAYIGYVENKFLKGEKQAERTCNTGFQELVYNNVQKEGMINLTFHQVFEEVGGEYLAKALSVTKGVNVVSPTWFRLNNNSGDFASLANASYVSKAHELGIEVWALVTDVDSMDQFGVEIDFVELLSSSANRRHLIEGLMAQVDSYGLDGINIDFEKVRSDSGIHFVQFCASSRLRPESAAWFSRWTTMSRRSTRHITTARNRASLQTTLLLWAMMSTMWAAGRQAPTRRLRLSRTVSSTPNRWCPRRKSSMPFRSIQGCGSLGRMGSRRQRSR